MSCNNCNNTPMQNMQGRMNYRGCRNGIQQGNYRNNRQNNCMQNTNGQYRNRQNIGGNSSTNCPCEKTKEQITTCNCDKIEKNRRENGCDVGKMHVDEMNPGMAYVPWQKWEDIFDLDEAIECGTIFKDLVKPYVGRSH